MPNKYDALFDQDTRSAASANLAGTDGVAPEQAASALRDAPLAGLAPSVGMRTPDLIREQATGAVQQSTLAASAPVATWAATADPAHLAVTKDDFPALAKIGQSIGRVIGNPFKDVANAFDRAVQSGLEADKMFASDPLGAIGKGLTESTLGIVASPFAAVTQPIARGILESGYPLRGVYLDGRKGPVLEGSAREQRAQELAGISVAGLIGMGGQAALRNMRPATPAPFPPASPFADRLPAPGPTPRPPPPGVNPVTDQLRTAVAEADAGAAAEIQSQIAQSQTHTRAPEVMESYLAQQLPEQSVSIDPEVLMKLGEDVFPGQAPAIIQAARDGEQFTVPLSTYLARTAGQPFAEQLNAATTFREGGLSVAEATEVGEVPNPNVVGMVPAQGVAPAFLGNDGKVYTGEIGTQHFSAVSPELRAVGMANSGFVDPQGNFLDRAQALEYVNANGENIRPSENMPGELDALDYREQSAVARSGAMKPAMIRRAATTPPLRPEVKVPEDFSPSEAQLTRTIAAEAHRELETVVQELRLRELYAEPKAVGTTATNFERYSAGIEEQIALATEKLTDRAVRQIKRERTPQWKERIQQNAAAVELELAESPAIRARAYLAQGRDPTGAPIEASFKLDRADAIAQYGKDLGLPDRMFGANGISADEAAGVFGFPTGADLIRALADLHTAQGDMTIAQHMKAMVQEAATVRTREELGFDLDPEAIHEAASAAIATPAIEDFLAADLTAFAKENGLPFDKPAMKAFAAERFESRKVKEAINIRQLETFLGRDSRKLETSLLKGDVPEAFKWKQIQYLHQLELGMAHKFLKTWNKAGRNIKVWAKKRAMKSMAQPYLDRIHQLLAVHGVPIRREEGELTRAIGGQTLEQFIESKRDQGQDITFNSVPFVPPPQMTVAQFQQWNDMLVSLAANGKHETTVIDGGKRVELATAIQEAYDGAGGIPNRPLDRNVGKWQPPGGRPQHSLRTLDAEHRILESLFDFMDGNNVRGVHNRVLQDGATDAANVVERLQNEIYTPIIAKFREIPSEVRNSYTAKLSQSALLDPRDGQPLTLRRGDLLSVLANMGTDANRAKLAEGYGTTVPAILDLLNQHLTKPEADFIQFVWDQLTDKLFPLADSNARNMRGYGLTKVQEAPVRLAVGTLKGGYFPLAYDPKFLDIPVDEGDPEVPLIKPFRPLTTPSGFEKERTGFTGPIMLALDTVLKDHLNEVFVRVAYGEYIQSARRFVLNPKIRQLWLRKLGKEYYDLLIPWLEYQVFDVGRPMADARGVEGVLRKLRQNLTLTTMGFSHSVGISQAMGSVPVISELGLVPTLMGYKQFMLDVLTGKVNANLYDKSEEMRYRHYNLEQNVRDVHEEMNALDITAGPVRRFYKGWADASMKYINFMDKWTVSGAAWTAAYRKALLELRMSEGDAIRYADKIVRKTQGTGRVADLPAVQRPNSEFRHILTFAYTWPGRYYNLEAEAIRDFMQGRFVAGSRKFFWLFLAVPIIAALKDGSLPDKDADPEEWLGFILRKFTLGLIGNSVYTRDAANWADRKMSGQMAGTGGTPLTRFLDALGAVVKFHDPAKHPKGVTDVLPGVGINQKDWVKHWAVLMGMAGFMPAGGQIGKTGQFLADVNTHKAKPRDINDWYTGLTEGKLEKKK